MTKSALALLAMAAVFSGSALAAPQDVPPDEKVVKFINDFVAAMETEGAMAANPNDTDIDKKVATAGKKAKEFYHRSHWNKTGDNLLADRLRFSFKKGFTGLKFYEKPAKITRVRKTTTTGIGFKETAEKGSVYDYFLAKKEGAAGRPAQIRIFISEGGEIKIDDLGSL